MGDPLVTRMPDGGLCFTPDQQVRLGVFVVLALFSLVALRMTAKYWRSAAVMGAASAMAYYAVTHGFDTHFMQAVRSLKDRHGL